MKKILIFIVAALIAGCVIPAEAQSGRSATKKTATTKRNARKTGAQRKKAARPFKGEFTYSDDKYDYTLYMDLYDAEPGYFTVSDKTEGGYMGMIISEAFQTDSPEPFIIVTGGLIPDDEDAVPARMFINQNVDGSITLVDENSYVFHDPATFRRVN